MRHHLWLLIVLGATAPLLAQAPAGPTLPEVAALMKPFLIEAIPPVLYEHSRNWGKTSMVPHAIHWRGLRPEIHKTPRNDGHWQKVHLSPRDLSRSLDFRMSNPRTIDAERQSFQIFLSFQATVDYEQQLWESGVRLYSDSTRARVRIMAWLDVENTVRLDPKKGSFVPDLVIRLRATNAKVVYNDFVVEHTLGIGGTGAKMVGEAMEGLIHELQPGLERRLLEKAGASLVKSADTRDIRLGLGSLLKVSK